MKKLPQLLILALMAVLMACGGSDNKKAQEESFEDLGDQAEFKEKHDEPKEMGETNFKGEMIQVSVDGGESANAYALMSEGSDKYLLVFHEWWGLNDYVKQEADRLSEELGEVNVIALDLYDGKIATVRDSAAKYMQSADKERIMNILGGAMKMIPSNASIGTIGWCFGGGWSLQASIEAGDRAEACVMYYGMPEKDLERLKKLESDVLFIFAEKDHWINQEVADEFAANMKKTDEELIVKSFDADHAFANPTQESYVEEAATEANSIALEFLKAELFEVEDDDEDGEDM